MRRNFFKPEICVIEINFFAVAEQRERTNIQFREFNDRANEIAIDTKEKKTHPI